MSSFSAAYTEIFAGAFGLAWHRALQERFDGRATEDFGQLTDSAFARGERGAFEVPDVAEVARWPRAVPEQGTVEFDAEVAQGRKLEDVEIEVREAYAAKARGSEPEAGASRSS